MEKIKTYAFQSITVTPTDTKSRLVRWGLTEEEVQEEIRTYAHFAGQIADVQTATVSSAAYILTVVYRNGKVKIFSYSEIDTDTASLVDTEQSIR